MRRQWYLIHCSYEFDTCPFLAFDNPTTAPIHCFYEVDACLLVGFWKSFNNFLLSTPHLRLIGTHRCSMKSLLQISFFQNHVFVISQWKIITIKWNERDLFHIFTWKRTISMFLLELNKSSHWERTSFHSLLFLAQITWRVRRYLILIVSRLFEMKRRDVWRQSISRLCIICQPHSSSLDRRLTSYAGISLSDLRCEVERGKSM